MKLSEAELDEFKKIYRLQFGAELTNEEATTLANRLLLLVQEIYKPFPTSDPSDSRIKY